MLKILILVGFFLTLTILIKLYTLHIKLLFIIIILTIIKYYYI